MQNLRVERKRNSVKALEVLAKMFIKDPFLIKIFVHVLKVAWSYPWCPFKVCRLHFAMNVAWSLKSNVLVHTVEKHKGTFLLPMLFQTCIIYIYTPDTYKIYSWWLTHHMNIWLSLFWSTWRQVEVGVGQGPRLAQAHISQCGGTAGNCLPGQQLYWWYSLRVNWPPDEWPFSVLTIQETTLPVERLYTCYNRLPKRQAHTCVQVQALSPFPSVLNSGSLLYVLQ